MTCRPAGGRFRPPKTGSLTHAAAGTLVLSSASNTYTGGTFVTQGTLQLGAGTAMVYPTLLAAIGDVAHPAWRASAVGVYRLWRDAGFAVGALTTGIVADLLGLNAAVWTVAGLTALSGLIIVARMYETHPPSLRQTPPDPVGVAGPSPTAAASK